MDNRNSILIVDDNPDNLELARILLENEGFAVFLAENAAETIERLRALHPQLILMDVQLPGMDGLTLTRRLRQDRDLEDVVIVALSAYAMKGDREKARAAGCDGYLTKPIDIPTFGATVRARLEEGRQHPPVGI